MSGTSQPHWPSGTVIESAGQRYEVAEVKPGEARIEPFGWFPVSWLVAMGWKEAKKEEATK